MIVFWVVAAMFVGLALLFVLVPLFKRGERIEDVDLNELNLAIFRQQLQELDADLATGKLDRAQYKAARRDLERELLYDVPVVADAEAPNAGGSRWTAVLLGLAVPAVAVFLYLYLGNSAIIPRLEAVASGEALPAHVGEGAEMPPLEVMVQRLADRLEQEPENLDGWMMLGRTYFVMGQPEGALRALERAYGLAPKNPDVLVAYADAVAVNNDGKLAGKPAELIHSALEIDPQHTMARWLDGMVSFQDARYAEAVEQWEDLIKAFASGSEEASELSRYVAEARSRAGAASEQQPEKAEGARQAAGSDEGPGPEQSGPEQEAQAAPVPTDTETASDREPPAQTPPATSLTVEVSLAEPLPGDVDGEDTVFVYAKAVSGPPMPLAVQRLQVKDLPASLTLDDSMAMMPAMKLSGFPEVTVGARVSKSGQAMPQSGDLEGELSLVKPGQSEPVKILIDRLRP